MQKFIKNTLKLIGDMDRKLFFYTIILFTFGLLNIVTASSQEAVVRYDKNIFHYFMVQGFALFIGTIATLFIIRMNTKAYKLWVPLLYFVIFGLSIFLTLRGGIVKGSSNWIRLPLGFNLQPSELAKPIIIAFLSLIFEKYNRISKTISNQFFELIWLSVAIGALLPLLVVIQGDMGTAGIMLAIFIIMFISNPTLGKYRKEIFSTIAIVGVLMVIVNPNIITNERIERFTSFIDPCSKYEEGGYQVCNVYIAINNGGLFGLGTGKSQQKYSYIPEPHTDSVFAIIAEEYGVWSTIIFLLYVGVLNRIMRISSKATTIRGRYIALGVGVYIFLHILINLGGLFGLIPLTGVPLPFLTYGGSFTLSLVIALAMVQRVNIETVNAKIKI